MSDAGRTERPEGDATARASLRIFVSYRRRDAPSAAARLRDSLLDAGGFRDADLFMDIDAIEPGADFPEVLEQQLESCDVMLSVVGPRWLSAADGGGRRRLDDPQDYVRLELEAALRRGVLVIPVLVEDAEMPSPSQLPESCRAFARRQALELGNTRWRTDVQLLLRTLDKVGREKLDRAAAAPAREAAAVQPPLSPAAATAADEPAAARAHPSAPAPPPRTPSAPGGTARTAIVAVVLLVVGGVVAKWTVGRNDDPPSTSASSVVAAEPTTLQFSGLLADGSSFSFSALTDEAPYASVTLPTTASVLASAGAFGDTANCSVADLTPDPVDSICEAGGQTYFVGSEVFASDAYGYIDEVGGWTLYGQPNGSQFYWQKGAVIGSALPVNVDAFLAWWRQTAAADASVGTDPFSFDGAVTSG